MTKLKTPAGYWVRVVPQDDGRAFLVTWSRGELRQHKAFASESRALAFAKGFIGRDLDHHSDKWGVSYWWAQS